MWRNNISEFEFQEEVGKEVVIGLDVVGLYPSISKKVAMEVCMEAALETEVEVAHMNMLEATTLLRLLALSWTKERCKSIPCN